MGYLSQKKKQERIGVFLSAAVILVALFTVAVFTGAASRLFPGLLDWYFQYYLLMLAVLGYALYTRYFWHALLMALFLLVNYVSLSSSSNLFFNIEGNGSNSLNIIYQNQVKNAAPVIAVAGNKGADIIAINPLAPLNNIVNESYRLFHEDADLSNSFILSASEPVHAGTVRFTPRQKASYVTITKNDHDIMVINVDFSKMKPGEEKVIFKNLTEFVLAQNVPVIIVGDFGLPSWREPFQEFLTDTGLEVKNRIILSDGKYLFNPFARPTINVLGYKALGLERIKFLNKSGNRHYPLLFRLVL